MFGFVTISDNDLSDSERERYRSVYCGVCRALKRRFGQLPRFALNNDLTFVALLLMSLYEPEETLGLGRCAAHPVKPRPYIESELVDYAADMTIVMAYHSMLDNWNDDRSYPSLAFSKVLKAGYERVCGRYPRQCSACERGLGNISRIERDQMQALRDVNDSESTLLDPDACANEFGAIMAEVLVFKEDEWSDELRSFGFELGRFVYQMDAVYDLPKDLESGSYNPFMQSDLDNDELRMLLMNRMAAVVDVFERLPLVQDVQILRSVLYAGVWGRLNARDQHDKEASQKRSSHDKPTCKNKGTFSG